jgi:hypothetical protein
MALLCPRWESNPHCGPFKGPRFRKALPRLICKKTASEPREHPTWARKGHSPQPVGRIPKVLISLTRASEDLESLGYEPARSRLKPSHLYCRCPI